MNPIQRCLPTLALALVFAAPLGLASPVLAAPAPAADIPAPAAPVAEVLVLTNATLHLGDGTVIEGGSLVLEGDKITRVEAGPITGVPGATSLDLGGKVVTPGLIAADTQLGLVEISLEASTHDDMRAGSGAIRAGYDPAPAINADSSLISIQAIEGVTTAAVAPGGGLISGEICWIDLRTGDYSGIVAAREIAVAANLGRSYQGSRAASLAELRRVLEDAQWYRVNQRNYERNQSRELAAHPADLEALWPIIDKQTPLVVRASRASDLLALIELGASLDIDITVVGAAEGWKVADELAAAKLSVIIQPSDNLPGSFDTLGARLDNAALLHAAGVRVAIGHFDTHNVRNMTQEAGLAVANGLPPEQAIAALTLNVAAAYGMDQDYGSLAVGKIANLVVWDGADPLELSTWAEQVYIRGEAIEMSSRQTKLRDRYMDISVFAD